MNSTKKKYSVLLEKSQLVKENLFIPKTDITTSSAVDETLSVEPVPKKIIKQFCDEAQILKNKAINFEKEAVKNRELAETYKTSFEQAINKTRNYKNELDLCKKQIDIYREKKDRNTEELQKDISNMSNLYDENYEKELEIWRNTELESVKQKILNDLNSI